MIPRVSEDVKVDERGRTVLELLQAHGMVLMNGLDGAGSGKATCRGVSVVDWVTVGHEMKGDCSPLEVEEEWMGGERGKKGWGSQVGKDGLAGSSGGSWWLWGGKG